MILRTRSAAVLVLVALAVSPPTPTRAAESFTVSGVLRVHGPGKLHVALQDAESFRAGSGGLKILVLDPPDRSDAVDVPFAFEGVAPGVYAIRCYQDRNGNGRLDMGLFGPSEPWGISGSAKRHMRRPRFEEASFSVPGVTTVVIEVQ